MRKRTFLSVLLAACLALTGCAAPEPAASIDFAPDESRRLVLYTSHKEEVYRPIVEEFEERTGIWVDVVTGGTNELLERIARESGAPKADVMFGGGVESLASYRGCFVPYTCAEADALEPQFRADDDLWTPFSALPVVLIYNTKLVDGAALTGWSSLFDETYAGRVAFTDPAISGSCFTALVTMLEAAGGDETETIHRFIAALGARELDDLALVGYDVARAAARRDALLMTWAFCFGEGEAEG